DPSSAPPGSVGARHPSTGPSSRRQALTPNEVSTAAQSRGQRHASTPQDPTAAAQRRTRREVRTTRHAAPSYRRETQRPRSSPGRQRSSSVSRQPGRCRTRLPNGPTPAASARASLAGSSPTLAPIASPSSTAGLAARPAESSRPDGTAAEPPPPRTAGPDRRTPAEKQVGPAPGPALPPPVPPELIPALWFEHRLQVAGWTLVPEPDRLRPPRTGIARRSWDLAISDARLGGLGWTERLETRSGIDGLHWALDARWAPPLLSASPAAVGLGGAVIAEGPEGAAVAAPRSSWHGAGLLAGPLGPSFGL